MTSIVLLKNINSYSLRLYFVSLYYELREYCGLNLCWTADKIKQILSSTISFDIPKMLYVLSNVCTTTWFKKYNCTSMSLFYS